MRDPILLDIPDRLESPRLTLRIARQGDGPALAEAIAESFQNLRMWMPWAQAIPTVEESELHCRKKYAEFVLRQDMQLLLFEKHTGRFVGSSGLHRIEWQIPKFEIGYWVRSSYEGKGLISEAVKVITDFAFQTLHAKRLEIRTDDANVRSFRVAERCGFKLEAVLKNAGVDMRGAPRDLRVYAKVAKEN